MDILHLIDESKDLSNLTTSNNNFTTNLSDLENNDQEQEEFKKKKRERELEYEQKMQKFMSMHMNNILSDIRDDIKDPNSNTEDSSNKESKEELERIYYEEVDFKLEIDSLANKLEKELNVNDTSKEEGSSNQKRGIEEEEPFKNKKPK
jgi:hypothetical protein